MRNYVMGAALLSLLAGCTAEWDSTRSTASRVRQDANGDAQNVTHAADSLSERAKALRGSAGFASLPDRGELLAYMQTPGQRLGGKQSAYRIRLSEEHAFNAAHEGGRIVVPTPDGGVATLDYERHVEHPDGNWSWIGRDANGADAVLTFGENAVFGTIPQRDGESLRLTTASGVAWLAPSAGSKIAPMGHGKRAPSADVMLPPQQAGDRSQSETPGAHGNITMVASDATPAATGATIDVLLGYTNGLASALGGQSQAATRMANLVDITNQAYANSGVTGRLRLVGSMQVTYPDNTDNGDALEQLSGQTETGPTTPNSAFSALRSARESTGADLVALVRDFRTPQNNGCGIAWLIGGGQSGITQADAPFGYAVVSDGSDVDEGDGFTYFCRDESLAHEFGHNMGQAHDQDNSNQAGVHAYSYGYSEASNSGFYTVMAYARSEDQFSIRYFANPNVDYDGRPTGVANSADNARSMNQTMPIVATFRASVTPTARNDLDGNGKTDLVFRHLTGSDFALWLMSGYSQRVARGGTRSATYRVATIADIDGDGRSEIVWTSDNRDLIFTSWNGSAFESSTSPSKYTAGYAVAGSADMNGDGAAELVLHNAGNGAFSVWFMDGFARKSSISGAMPAAHRLVATADFDGDGRQDLLWTSAAKNLRYVSYVGGSLAFHASPSNYYSSTYAIVAAADVDGNGKSEIVLHNADTGQFSTWFVGDNWLRKSSKSSSVPVGYRLSSMGDFAGTGREDLLWTNTQRNLLYTTWSDGQIASTLAYAAGYRPADGP